MNYLYNGIEFPALPERDEKMYPYVYLKHSDDYGTVLLFSSVPCEIRFTAGTLYQIGVWNGEYCDFIWYEFNSESGEWFVKYTYTEFRGTITSGASPLVWANYDVCYEDGTLYLAASDPIPVGSAPEVEPKSFMAGLRMGQIVKYYGIGV